MVATRRSSMASFAANASAFLARAAEPSDRDSDCELTPARQRRSSTSHSQTQTSSSPEIDITSRDSHHPLPPSALPNLALLCVCAAAAALMLNVVLEAGIVTAGLVGPAWRTFQALERGPDVSVARWARFWAIAAVLFALDRASARVGLQAVLPGPMYAAGVFSALAWLQGGEGRNAGLVYDALRPGLVRYEDSIESGIGAMGERVNEASRYGLVKVSECIRPIATQLEQAADAAQREADRKRLE